MAEAGPSQPSPPPPPTPPPGGAGAEPRASVVQRIGNSRGFRYASAGWRWRGTILGGLAVGYAVFAWNAEKRRARKRDAIPEQSYLYWKLYDGGIVEAKSAGSNLNYLLSSSQGGAPEEPPRVMTIFDVVRTIKFIENDDRVRGIIADFSHTSIPSVPSYNLGLAQLEEVQDALLELRRVKHEKFGADGWRTVAWTDTFTSQGQYLLASAFDEVYCQPTGEVPLVGLGSTTPFFGRLARWLGIEVHAEARNEYKSFVQPYIDEKLTDPQRENHAQLINDLNDNLLTYIGRNRFPSKGGREALEHVRGLSQIGPFTARTALESGLINGTCYRQDVLDSVLDPEAGGSDDHKLFGFYHYHKVIERAVEKYMKDAVEVGVVYLLGTIGDPGEFGTAAVVRGLKEAGEDDTIGAVVLRIDSGGGAVVDSDTIAGAVRDLREKYGKTVVASFGNASASGGYWVSTHTDAILAAPSTITGSIGVASLRPTFLQSFFDRFHITLESFFTGSRASDPTHRLTPSELERHSRGVDDMYASFKERVCDGRGVDPAVIEGIAGGRVMSGLRAFGLVAPPELIEQIKGLDVPPLNAEDAGKVEESERGGASSDEGAAGGPKDQAQAVARAGGEREKAASTDDAVGDTSSVVALAEDQDTSPFAVPEPAAASAAPSPPSAASNAATALADATVATSSSPDSSASPTSSDDPAALNASSALASSSEAEQSTPGSLPASETAAAAAGGKGTAAGALNGAAGLYDYEPGPYGRGLVDGLGGLRDSAIYACQLFIANGIAGYKEQHPGTTDEQAMRDLLPDVKYVQAENGELALALDVTLKRFPVQKSFWQQLADASRRGDSLGDSVHSLLGPQLAALRTAAARWFVGAIADSVVDELNAAGGGSGAPGVDAGVGLGARYRQRMEGKRAEWNGGRW
ncbi:uncharacterized protein JCM10292_005296 [Rhodotorula paludigena]|uniref:uncharacterized protein n=1 Tax=Rhodotorula paludigena TaxID=86838 RepID=UPI00316B0CAF